MRLERDVAALRGAFDLAVVGGGITGISVAREAAGRGLRTLLVDKADFGAGTSSATTKYIHGGIRYLEQYEFDVVRESLRERRILSLAAPHLVQPVRFLMPAWRWSKPSAPLLAAGVLAYDLLAFDKNWGVPDSLHMPKPRWVSRHKLLEAVPWLQPDQLQGAFAYPDVLNIHPERLLLALAQSAVQLGAVLLNHARADRFLLRPDDRGRTEVHGLVVVDELTGDRHEVQARTVVNAGGPWMDVVLRGTGRDLGVGVQRSKGVHLLTRALGGRDAVFARAPSGRHVIVSPWQGYSFIGPTDTAVDEEPDDVRAVADDVDLILDTVNATSTTPLTRSDIQHVTVGIRPLVKRAGGDSYLTSRRHEVYDHAEAGLVNVWSIGGGKWTTGRALAEHVLDAVAAAPALAGVRQRPYSSRRAPVWGAFAWASDAGPYLDGAARSRRDVDLPTDVRLHLARLYGTAHTEVLDLVAAEPALGRRLSNRSGRLDIAAQVVHAVVEESARTAADAIDRRLVLGTLGGVTAAEVREVVALMAPLLGWDETRATREEQRYAELTARVTALR
jgi:glycerol-3-phosphate dehydrogenase